jgi:DNA (cytosine-5)-methyltransferase 3A
MSEMEEMSIFDFLPPKEAQRPRYMDGARVLSLFDGMSCGMLAMLEAGVKVDRYVAYEIDKYAVQTSSHNFPTIEQRGDVFHADFTEFEGFDWLVGGSPCTYWSIAQKNNRETEASGMGWELFSQYVRALREAKPAFFIYENNKSMSKAIRQSITQTFGFDAICINSALVSAQNRQRLYWVGKRNADGTYSKVEIEQPEDRGILLRDVLDGATDREKARSVICSAGRTTHREYYQKHQGNMAFEPIGIGYRGRMDNGKWVKQYESNGTEKAKALTTAQTDSMCAEPVNTTADGKAWTIKSQYYKNGLANIMNDNAKGCQYTASGVAEPCRVGCLPSPDGTVRNSQAFRIYSPDGKSVNLTSQGGGAGAKTGLYAVECNPPYATPVEWDESGKPIKAISAADGKTYTVYEVKGGQITIKGKTYPIKLPDGFYIIRKLTARECMRLQTVPEWYEFPVSDSQAYKMLGNGWTVAVIAHLIKGAS